MAECPYSKQIWSVASTWAHCPPLSPSNWTADQDLQSWFVRLTAAHSQQKKGLGSLILLVLWSLWKERNNRIFKKEELPVPRFISLLKDDLRVFGSLLELNI